MGSSIELRGLTRRYAGSTRPSLDDLHLQVGPGETVALVGPSGCGKSTTLRLIAGLDAPDAGRVLVDDEDVTRLPPQQRDVAMVFQGFALYPHMTVREILAFPLRMRRVRRSERDDAVDHAASLLGIEGLLHRRPAQLSGGERQRVAMGRAIVRRPKVFLFDEPLSNLDAGLRAELRGELGHLLRRLAATALYVTHDQSEAMTLGHRIALLREGRLEQVDTPRRIYEEPATAFAAGFFGSPPMNVVLGRLEAGRIHAGTLMLPAPPGSPERVVVGLRPEHLLVVRDPRTDVRESSMVRAPATTTSVEPLGAETHVGLAAGEAVLRARVEGFSSLTVGEAVTVVVAPEHVRFFDSVTGRAL